MQRVRALLALCFAVLGGLALFVSRSDAVPDTVKLIVPGVWFREGDLDGKGHCNNAIIEMKDYLIVVDANFPSGALAAIKDARRISVKPVKYVFDTHHHGDHAYGNAVWTKNGATTLAFAQVAEEMKKYEPARWQSAAARREDVKAVGAPSVEPPTQLINENLYVLNDGSRKVEFRHYGWAHTRGDGFVYLPKEQLLCTGDAVVNGPHNFMGDGNIGNWPNVTRALGRLKVKHLLPGHGEPGGREILTGQEQFMVELHKAVKSAIDAGRKPEELKASVTLPDSVKMWVGNSLERQLRDAYEEISKGKPRGELPH
jgi:glyoxylase-like metal-dependent hydrolase (beta-lactamase superfamily II)